MVISSSSLCVSYIMIIKSDLANPNARGATEFKKLFLRATSLRSQYSVLEEVGLRQNSLGTNFREIDYPEQVRSKRCQVNTISQQRPQL